MASNTEEEIMRKIGLGQHYSWFNGSGSCRYIREEAIKHLPLVLADYDMTLTPAWAAHLKRATQADGIGTGEYRSGDYRLTNTWIACSYAIQDACYRQAGDAGFEPEENFHFWNDEQRQHWQRMNAPPQRRHVHLCMIEA